jgi:cysteinyl-tRNA synthetase
VHYRKPLTYSFSRLEDARRSLRRLDRCVRSLRQIRGGRPCPDVGQLIYDLRQGLRAAFDDDLNLPAAIAALFQTVKRINSLVAGNLMDAQGAGRLIAVLRDLDTVLGIFNFDDAADVDSETRELIQARDLARAERNWPLADRLRREILARGVNVQDSKTVTS